MQRHETKRLVLVHPKDDSPLHLGGKPMCDTSLDWCIVITKTYIEYDAYDVVKVRVSNLDTRSRPRYGVKFYKCQTKDLEIPNLSLCMKNTRE